MDIETKELKPETDIQGDKTDVAAVISLNSKSPNHLPSMNAAMVGSSSTNGSVNERISVITPDRASIYQSQVNWNNSNQLSPISTALGNGSSFELNQLTLNPAKVYVPNAKPN